jgi:lectin, mannose-binding 1
VLVAKLYLSCYSAPDTMRASILTAVHILGFASTSLAQSLVNELSFGQTSPLSENGANIPGFHILGEGHVPRLMSDRVIMTPPSPGNKRGALWADKKNTATDWKVDLEFRASGPERAGGNVHLWYVANGKGTVSLSTIYNVRKFDGLALVIDTHGGTSGTIRGFLNDGTKDHRNDPNVDGLAFGHCDYAYRNLGRPSKLTLKSSPSAGLQVLIDDRPCFSSDKISLPSDYYFGITTASSEPPDSFEVFKLTTTTSTTPPSQNQQEQQQQQQQQQQQTDQQHQQTPNAPTTEPNDSDPTTYSTSSAQFADLHNRLQLLSHAVHNLFREISAHTLAEEKRYNEILTQLPSAATMTNLDHRVQNIELMIAALKHEVETGDHKGQFERIHDRLERAQAGISEHLPEVLGKVVSSSAPRMGFLVGVVVVVQIGLAVAYVVYKRRRGQGSKKYL